VIPEERDSIAGTVSTRCAQRRAPADDQRVRAPSRLSLKALRLSERLGLLTPAIVDPADGYRRYREAHVFTARLTSLSR
jgi:DNA-binding transcriptional MerR regulator